MIILYLEGGIYTDLFQINLVPFDYFIDFNSINTMYILKNAEICFIATFKNNIIIKKLIEKQINNILNRNYGINKLDITCSFVFRRIINSLLDRSKT